MPPSQIPQVERPKTVEIRSLNINRDPKIGYSYQLALFDRGLPTAQYQIQMVFNEFAKKESIGGVQRVKSLNEEKKVVATGRPRGCRLSRPVMINGNDVSFVIQAEALAVANASSHTISGYDVDLLWQEPLGSTDDGKLSYKDHIVPLVLGTTYSFGSNEFSDPKTSIRIPGLARTQGVLMVAENPFNHQEPPILIVEAMPTNRPLNVVRPNPPLLLRR